MAEARQDFFPYYFLPGINEGDSWHFQDANQIIDVSDTSGHIGDILRHANGHNSLEEILKNFEQSGADTGHVARVIQDLRQLGILTDSREIMVSMHESTDNPQTFSRSLTPLDVLDITLKDTYEPRRGRVINIEPVATYLGELSLSRESCRDFSPEPIEPQKIMACLRNAYSGEDHPVPSAGGLYPLRIYMIQKVDTPELTQGLYHYDHNDQKLIQIDSQFDALDLSYVFGNEDLIHNAPTIIVIAADLQRQNSKYANRAYRYTLLEAGHSAQNIHLTASEIGLSTLEFGGYRDSDLATAFDMPEQERPLVTIAIGYKNLDSPGEDIDLDTDLIKGPGKPVEWSLVDFSSPASKLLRFYRATAKFQKPNSAYGSEQNLLASGTAASPQLAEIKAAAEAYERYAAGQVRYDILETAANIGEGNWLSPDLVRPLSDKQLQQIPYLERFDPNKPIQWIKGRHVSGKEVYVPIDLVFYPIDPSAIGRPLIAEADSSGMAAHTNRQEATKRALLELAERDAIMKTWLSKEAPSKIDLNSLPVFYQKRAKFWGELNKVFEVLDFSHDDIAIAGVVIRSKDDGYPFMVNGASASVASFEEALKKASHEAELSAAEFVTSKYKVRKLSPAEVFSPADHANFYAYRDYRSEIEWLWSGPHKAQPDSISGNMDILGRYDPIIIGLTQDSDPLQVVRVIAPELVPISFGYGKELYLHPAIKQFRHQQSAAPHFFA